MVTWPFLQAVSYTMEAELATKTALVKVQEEVKLEKDIMLNSLSLRSLEEYVPQVGEHLEVQGWATNPNKIQGPELSIKF